MSILRDRRCFPLQAICHRWAVSIKRCGRMFCARHLADSSRPKFRRWDATVPVLERLPNGGLLCHRAERQYSFAEQFVKHLRESGVNRGESAEDSFITGEMFEPATGCGEIAVGEQQEQD